MIDQLLKRKPIREFLKNYSSKLWSDIITDVFEIGVLNLKNSFNSLSFTKEEFNNVLFDLREIDKKNLKTQQTQQSQKTQKPQHPQKKSHPSSKPQSDTKHHLQKYTQTASSAIDEEHSQPSISATPRHEDAEEEESVYSIPGASGNKPTTFKAEVYIPNEEEVRRRSRSNSRNRPRKQYYTTPENIKEQNKENNRNLYYAESKIRAQILNDKMIHEALKRNQPLPNKDSSYQAKNSNTNYMISYDKQLKPETIQRKERETPIYYYSNNDNNSEEDNERNIKKSNLHYDYNNDNSEVDNSNNDVYSNVNNNQYNSEQEYNSRCYEQDQGSQYQYQSMSPHSRIQSESQYGQQQQQQQQQQGVGGRMMDFGRKDSNIHRQNSNPNPQLNYIGNNPLSSLNNNYKTNTMSSSSKNTIPIINSMNTVETANFNHDKRGDNNNNNLFYQQQDSNEHHRQNLSDMSQGEAEGEGEGDMGEEQGRHHNARDHDSISFKNNGEDNEEEKGNQLMKSNPKSEDELSLCNVSQRTKMLFRREMGNWENQNKPLTGGNNKTSPLTVNVPRVPAQGQVQGQQKEMERMNQPLQNIQYKKYEDFQKEIQMPLVNKEKIEMNHFQAYQRYRNKEDGNNEEKGQGIVYKGPQENHEVEGNEQGDDLGMSQEDNNNYDQQSQNDNQHNYIDSNYLQNSNNDNENNETDRS